MRTRQGVIAMANAPARGSDDVLLTMNRAMDRFATILTREEAAEFGRQLVTAAYGRRMIVVEDRPAASVATGDEGLYG